MAYKHGVYVSEVPTSIIPPVRTTAGLPFVVGTAPINLTDKTNVNRPVLCYSYQEAVEALDIAMIGQTIPFVSLYIPTLRCSM